MTSMALRRSSPATTPIPAACCGGRRKRRRDEGEEAAADLLSRTQIEEQPWAVLHLRSSAVPFSPLSPFSPFSPCSPCLRGENPVQSPGSTRRYAFVPG